MTGTERRNLHLANCAFQYDNELMEFTFTGES